MPLVNESQAVPHAAVSPVEPTPDPTPAPGMPEPGEPHVPGHEPERTPWDDPGPPVRKINLPPDQPGHGVPVENPRLPLQ